MCFDKMADILQSYLENSSSEQLLDLLSRYLGTPEPKRDCDFYLSLKSMLITLKERDMVLDGLACRVTHEMCLPLVRCWDSQGDRHKIHIVYEVIALCCVVGPKHLSQEVISICLKGLSHHFRDVTTSTGLPVVVCIDLICYLMKIENSHSLFEEDVLKEVFENLLSVLYQSDQLMCVKITSSVLPLFLSLETEDGQNKINIVWRRIKEMSSDHYNDDGLKLCYSIMCSLADYLIASSNTNLVLWDSRFWELIQQGLIIQDPLSSKRSMYLLKRALDHIDQQKLHMEVKDDQGAVIFYWNTEEQKYWMDIWQEFVLLMETLNETQVHVIIPVLPRISKIILATEKKKDGCQALDISWLITVIRRASLHPSRFIRKWAVTEILTMNISESPLLWPTNWFFLLGHFQTMLNEYSLYGKDENSGKASPVGIALLQFYNLCLFYLPKEQHTNFLTKLITSIENERFTAVPIVFVSQALSNIKNASVLGSDALLKLRNILFQLRTHAINLRLPTKGFLLVAATKLTDSNILDWDIIYNLLATGQLEECLTRGSWLWSSLCEWLWKIDKDKEAVCSCQKSSIKSEFCEGLFHFLGLKIEKFVNSPDVDKNSITNSAEALAHLTIAAADTLQNKQYDNCRSSPFVSILNKITQNFKDANTRLYMSDTKLSKSAELLSAILRVLNSSANCKSCIATEDCSYDNVINVVNISLSKATPDILNLLYRKLTIQDGSQSGKIFLTLCNSLHCYFSANDNLDSRLIEFYKFIENVVMINVNTIQRLQSNKEFELKEWALFHNSMLFVAWCCEIITTDKNDISASISEQVLQAIPSFQLNLEFKKPEVVAGAINRESIAIDTARNTSSSWGNSVSEFMSALWTTSVFYLQFSKDTHDAETSAVDIVGITSHVKDVLSAALDALDITSNVRPIIKSIGLIIPKLLEVDVDSCARALNVVWSTLRDTWESTSFWEDFPVFLSVFFSPVLLQLPAEDHRLTKKIKGYLETLLDEGEIRPGLMHIVVQQLSNVWVDQFKTDSLCSLVVYQDTIIKLLLFGPMINKAKRIESHVESFLHHNGNQSPVLSSDMRDDAQVRVIMINTLLSLDISKSHTREIIKSIIRSLIALDKEISDTQTVIYINSKYHRKKHRAWQTILMFLPLVLEHDTEGDYAKEILQSVFTSILDQNQLSVHNFQEWVVLCILIRYPDLTTLLWDEMLYHSDKRIGRLVSLITIAMLFAINCVSVDHCKRASYFSRALTAVFPWVTTNNRSVRVVAQVAVQKMWYYCVSENLETVLKENSIVEPCLALIIAANDTLAEKIRLLENYFFFDFHPVRDYSVTTIYHTIPKHSGITEEEWLTPEEFLLSSIGKTLWMSTKCNGIPLYNESRRLANFESMPYDYQSKEKIGVQFERRFREERRPNLNMAGVDSQIKDAQEPENPALNFQKKMIAWKIVPPEEVMMAELQQQRMVALQKSGGGNLVVVASLIDKAPNLGGLCRTSEVFGVRKLVLGSSEIMKDQSFKKLSVSSSKWIDIEQVRPIDLKKYLQNMRRQGYTLIGVEQTANSQPLTQYQFPHDALFLLGNEKEGIPADLIQLLDECIEIPQVGIIRSLNVHVSGALLIWEYTRQRVFAAKNTAE